MKEYLLIQFSIPRTPRTPGTPRTRNKMVILTAEGTMSDAFKTLETQVSALTRIEFALRKVTSVSPEFYVISGEKDGITHRLVISKIFASPNNVWNHGIGIWQVNIPNELCNHERTKYY